MKNTILLFAYISPPRLDVLLLYVQTKKGNESAAERKKGGKSLNNI